MMGELYEDYKKELLQLEMLLEIYKDRREFVLGRLRELRSHGFY